MGEHCWQESLLRLAEETGRRLAGQQGALPALPLEEPTDWRWPKGAVARWWFALLSPEDFLAAAYEVVLGRAADASGLAAYAPWCGTWLGRVAVLAALVGSEEGQAKGARVAGVRRWSEVWHGLQRLRLGRLERWVSGWLWRRDALRALPWLAARTQQWVERDAERRRAWSRWAEAVLAELVAVRERVGGQEEALIAVRTLASHVAAKVARSVARDELAFSEAERARGGAAKGLLGDEVLATFYRDLEAAFRDGAEVAQKVRVYLPWVAPYLGELVVDLGCGRGDWLAVAMGHGHRVLGVECNAALAEEAAARGVPVVLEDGLGWLRAQREGSVAVISALHVLEHLPFAEVLAWLQEAARVVRPGGMVFFETPNPENGYVATHHFFNDPTHVRPLTPDLLAFALSWAGFAEVEVVRLHPLPGRIEGQDPASERLNGWLHGPQDFCVRGVKR